MNRDRFCIRILPGMPATIHMLARQRRLALRAGWIKEQPGEIIEIPSAPSYFLNGSDFYYWSADRKQWQERKPKKKRGKRV